MAVATDKSDSESFVSAVGEVSERVSALVREEIELAKAEVVQKGKSLLRGTVAIAAGAVFGVFAVFMGLETLAWGLDDIFENEGPIWVGFLIVFALLLILAVLSFLFAWRKLKVGAPTPKMAIDEAKLIRQTVATKGPDGQ